MGTKSGISALIFVYVLFAGAIMAGGHAFKSVRCEARWSGMYETSYGLLTGCQVNVNGVWKPERQV